MDEASIRVPFTADDHGLRYATAPPPPPPSPVYLVFFD
jgi:hypothetical protein